MCVELAWIAGRCFARDVPGHLHVSTQRQKRQPVIRVAVTDAKKSWTEAYRKCFDAHAAPLGYGKVPKLVHEHHKSKNNREFNNDLQKVHN